MSTPPHPTARGRVTGPGGLAGTAWVVSALGDAAPPAEGDPAGIVFGDDGRLTGNGGVNRFAGPYELRGDELVAGPLMSTRMAGPPAWMAVEARLMAVLDHPVRVVRTAEGLILDAPDGAVVLVPAPPETPGA